MIDNQFILLSFINTKLRDEFENLDCLCECLCIDKDCLISKLKEINYEYNEKENKFI